MITTIVVYLIGVVMSIAAMVVLFAFTARLVIGTRDTAFEPLVKLTIVPAFVFLDWLYNWSIASIVFMEFPRTPGELVTARMKRYKRDYQGLTNPRFYEKWRFNLSIYLCRQLSHHDKNHC